MVTKLSAADIISNLQTLNTKIQQITTRPCTLLAVSKTKPVEDIQVAYEGGQRHYGENYIEEFAEKAPQLPSDIIWHFIGHIQSNKAKKLVSVPNLAMIESLDSIKLAGILQKELVKVERQSLDVLVQVHSGEEGTKNGLPQDEVPKMLQYLKDECPRLRFCGFMAMGKLNDKDGFQQIQELANKVKQESEMEEFVISMGTSQDFEMAIEEGATQVRLGSTIFGARSYPKKE